MNVASWPPRERPSRVIGARDEKMVRSNGSFCVSLTPKKDTSGDGRLTWIGTDGQWPDGGQKWLILGRAHCDGTG
jgi:hypothetical protein